jgi:hypothetical protein
MGGRFTNRLTWRACPCPPPLSAICRLASLTCRLCSTHWSRQPQPCAKPSEMFYFAVRVKSIEVQPTIIIRPNSGSISRVIRSPPGVGQPSDGQRARGQNGSHSRRSSRQGIHVPRSTKSRTISRQPRRSSLARGQAHWGAVADTFRATDVRYWG